MARILLPTDFSAPARHAAEYAVHLFGRSGNEFILLHAYMDMYVGEPIAALAAPELMRLSEEGLVKAADELVRVGAQGIRHALRYGSVSAAVRDHVREEGADVVVLGRTGGSGLGWFGSNSVDLLQHGHLPVIVVPEQAPLIPLRCILLADDHEEVHQRNLSFLREFALRTGARVVVTHVSTNAGLDVPHWSAAIYEAGLNGVPHSSLVVHREKVVEGLEFAARGQEADMVVLLHRHIGFFEGLFHHSTAKEFALRASLPLLVLEQ